MNKVIPQAIRPCASVRVWRETRVLWQIRVGVMVQYLNEVIVCIIIIFLQVTSSLNVFCLLFNVYCDLRNYRA